MFSYASAVVRLLLYALWTLILIGPYAGLRGLGRGHRALGLFYWRVVARIIRLDVRAHGRLAADRPLLVVANHVSYLDIVVLGGLIPGAFVAKAEVGTWPGFGTLARLARTILIDRRRTATGEARAEIQARLGDGEPLILFPEGTSSDGNRVLPFKSALFAVVDGAVTVQPVSIAYTRVDGLPASRAWRPLFAWYGAMDMAPHLMQAVAFGQVRVEVIFHPPVAADAFPSRKALSAHCQKVVAAGASRALAGRDLPGDP